MSALLVCSPLVFDRLVAVKATHLLERSWADINTITDEELNEATGLRIVVSNIVEDDARNALITRLQARGTPPNLYDVQTIEALEAGPAEKVEDHRAKLRRERKDWHRADQEAKDELAAEALTESATGERFVVFDEDFWSQPPATFVVPDLLIEGQIGVIYAQGGIGKSLLSQDVSVGLSHRGRVFGVGVEKVPVFYVDEEGSRRGLMKRLKSMGYEGEKLELLHYSLLAGWAPLDTAEGGEALVAEVVRTKARLVVLDTASKLISGEENANDTWSRMHRHTMIPLRRAGISVLIVDHAGKDLRKGQRGGSSKQNNIDVVWLLEVAGSVVKLTCEKDRDGDYAPVLYLERNEAPVLEHVRASESVSAAFESYLEFETAVDDCITTLNSLGVPRTASQATASRDLKDAGYEDYKRVVVREAVARRKALVSPSAGESEGDDDDD